MAQSTLLILLLLVSSLTNVLAVANEVALAAGRGRPPFSNKYLSTWVEGYRHGIGTTQTTAGEAPTVTSPYFLPRELRDAFRWLDTNGDPSDVILAPVYLSYLVPYLTGKKVHYGPSVDPVDGDHRSRFVQNQLFFDLTRSNRERLQMIQANGIDLVLFWFTQPIEEQSAKELARQLETSLPVRAAYHNRRALILQVIPER